MHRVLVHSLDCRTRCRGRALPIQKKSPRRAGYKLVGEYYDQAVSGDALDARPGFAAMLEHIARNGVRTIIVLSWHSNCYNARAFGSALEGSCFALPSGVSLLRRGAHFLADRHKNSAKARGDEPRRHPAAASRS
jgi:Resolvase, N terminal domain